MQELGYGLTHDHGVSRRLVPKFLHRSDTLLAISAIGVGRFHGSIGPATPVAWLPRHVREPR